MKNIILLGAPRSGKSTFAKMILKEYSNYNLIQEDVISSAYMSALKGVEFEKEENRFKDKVNIQINMNFVNKMIKAMFDFSVLYEPKLNFILDTSGIELEEVSKYDPKNTIVLIFGYPDITPKQGVRNVLKHDTKEDWTYIESESNIQKLFEVYIEKSKKYKKECKRLNLKFINTSYKRKAVLNKLFDWVKVELEK